MLESTLPKPTVTSSIQGLQCPLCRQRAHQHLMTYPGRTLLFRNRTVAKCIGCSLTYMYPMAAPEVLDFYYNSGAHHDESLDPHQARAQVGFIKKHLAISGQFKVLNLGRGVGTLESELRRSFPEIPISFTMEADLGSKDDESFDLILLGNGFERKNDPVGYLKKLRSYCHDGTYVFIDVPNEEHKFKFDLEPAVLFFDPKMLSAVLKAAGFTVLGVETCGLRRPDQRSLNMRSQSRSEWVGKLPFKWLLRRIKTPGSDRVSVPPEPSSLPDTRQCDVYGEDRVWIRTLAHWVS